MTDGAAQVLIRFSNGHSCHSSQDSDRPRFGFESGSAGTVVVRLLTKGVSIPGADCKGGNVLLHFLELITEPMIAILMVAALAVIGDFVNSIE
jgi:hypothetical protein